MSAGADGRTHYSGTGDDIDPNETREQREARRRAIAGQRKDPTQKKAGRHADVIDKWDPTGLGTAVWHHSGPYDAAAPSRNVNQPTTRAPMQAFGAGGSPPRLTPPAVPAKDEILRRGSAPRPVSSGRRTSGGLSGTYSTSVPTSGGYFPDLQEVEDDGSRTNRLRQRDEKERALKAAWGIDTPEPFEDFGTSPRDEAITLNDDNYSSFARNQQAATSPGPRSPGLRNPFGGRSRSPPMEEMIAAPVADEERPRNNSMSRPGVKRTKSLMQRLKSMRDPSGQRGTSPHKYSPSHEYPPMPTGSPGTEDRRSRSGRGSGANSGPSSASATGGYNSPTRERADDQEVLEPQDGGLKVPTPPPVPPRRTPPPPVPSNHNGDLKSALRRDREGSSSGAGQTATTSSSQPSQPSQPFARKLKTLPQPPVMPVMPDFDDIMQQNRRRSSAAQVYDPPTPEGAQVKRKTSVVKKLAARVTK